MKEKGKGKQRLIKGTPTAVLASIFIHAALFLLAGMFVVFTVVKHKEVEFAPPKPVERPRMTLKKPKAKVRKTTKPKPTTRIVTKVRKANMPDIQLPEISMGEGLGDVMDGFDLLPSLDETSVFGSGQSIGNDFVGIFYDFLKDSRGRRVPLTRGYVEILRGFVKGGWKKSYFSRYYHSPKKLYATTCMFPLMESIMARVAFNEFEEGQRPNDYKWGILYEGRLVCPASHTNGITFRFWGEGSTFLIVEVDGKTVLDAPLEIGAGENLDPTWHSSSAESYRYHIGNGVLTVGDWIALEPGKPLEMKYFFSDWGGGEFSANLLVEVKGEKYPRNRWGGPILPIFKTAELSYDQLDELMELMVYDAACLTNGPVFCDYDTAPRVRENGSAQEAENATNSISESVGSAKEMRTWTLVDGRTVEGRLKTLIMNSVLLETPHRRQKKIALSKLSDRDREIVELSHPPAFNIDFSKTSSMRTVPPSNLSGWEQPKLFDYTFGAILKQTSAGIYNHPLTVEYFAIGKQINGNGTYVLLDRQKATFTPVGKDRDRFAFHGDPVLLFDYVLYAIHMGEHPLSYLITVTDQRGEIIQYATPKKWLFEHLDNLKKLRCGNFMDNTCTRKHPDSPKIGTRHRSDRMH